MIRSERFGRGLFRNYLPLAAVFLPLVAGATAPAYTTDGKQGRAMCELFLSAGYASLPKVPMRIPLALGGLPSDWDTRILFTRAEAENYLHANPDYLWREDLNSVLEELKTGDHLIYLSELGPTLWTLSDFGAWTKAVNGQLPRDAKAARAALIRLAHGESIEGISVRAEERVRNSFLARVEAMRVENEWRIQQARYFLQDPAALGRALYGKELRQPHEKSKRSFYDQMLGIFRPAQLPPDPFTGQPGDLSQVDPENREAVVVANFSLNATRQATLAAHEIRAYAPSLRLPWANDFYNIRERGIRPNSLEDLQSIKRDEDVLWIVRTLFREDLVRRRVTEGKTLAERLDGDNLFFLAAYPELVGIWREAAKWKFPIRHTSLEVQDRLWSPELINERSPKPELIQLVIQRNVSATVGEEKVDLSLVLTNSDSFKYDANFIQDSDLERIRLWFSNEWQEFENVFGVHFAQRPRLFRVRDGDRAETIWKQPGNEWALIEFFAYLYEKFPTLKGFEREPYPGQPSAD